MVGLVTANQFNLTPNVPGIIQGGLSLGEQFRAKKLQEQQDQFLQGVDGQGASGPNALAQSAKLGLDFQKKFAASMSSPDRGLFPCF